MTEYPHHVGDGETERRQSIAMARISADLCLGQPSGQPGDEPKRTDLVPPQRKRSPRYSAR